MTEPTSDYSDYLCDECGRSVDHDDRGHFIKHLPIPISDKQASEPAMLCKVCFEALPKVPSDTQMVIAAQTKYNDEGHIEIDDKAPVSRTSDNNEEGAYVQAWVWVYDHEAHEVRRKA